MTSAETSARDADTGDEPLTPFPRRNHLARMRRARNRRRTRAGVGATLALTLALSGTGLAASWATPTTEADPVVESAAAVAQASDELRAEQTAHSSAQETLDSANGVLDDADESVDTHDLETLVERLADYRKLTPTFTLGLVQQTETETASVSEASAAAKKQKAEEAEKKAAEEAKRAEEEAKKKAAANTPEGAKAAAKTMAADQYGWGEGEFSCLVSLWNKESGWSYTASNPSSGAYGIPQALPGSKMGSVASDWETNAITQITWGLQYISGTYGSPCAAWGHSQSTGWY
ncbi:phospholipase [Microbacterium sp. MPKO10]|uniref:aggregation-promoting factor C-terminal-like domain-containing protein n=1 Tax=Microbacterium sp. MPKO10 TaxID=2989818 RepID=UPI002236BFBB|nr:phospholipase [Microbacterium sp. MPKO10]MCW4459174.1 phospholipase [Microbacterium sp. MPKO10]